MPHPQKKRRLEVSMLEEGGQSNVNVSAADHDYIPSFDDLGTELLANIFGFLAPEDIMLARLNNKMRDAAKKAIVSPTNFYVNSLAKYNAMAAMTTALPNLQQIELCYNVGCGRMYRDGEDPDEIMAARTASWITHEIDIISNFRKLRILEVYTAPLNGRYPSLFNFPLLQSLTIRSCPFLKWDLEIMLTGMPSLTELECYNNRFLTGNINSLRVLRGTLKKVTIENCRCVEGNFMDLSDFPHLKMLNLIDTDVRGDIREIGGCDFLSLEHLTLPHGVYGGTDYEFQNISDAPDVISTLYSIKKQRPNLLKDWYGTLSEDSPDWHDGVGGNHDTPDDAEPPFHIRFVQAGSRVGYRWETFHFVEVGVGLRVGYRWEAYNDNPCEVNWLDPEPDKESSDYEKYIVEFHEIERQVDSSIYRGFHQPPTEEEYNRLWEECNRKRREACALGEASTR